MNAKKIVLIACLFLLLVGCTPKSLADLEYTDAVDIIVAFVDNSQYSSANVYVKNVSGKSITGLEVSFVGFDKSGLVTNSGATFVNDTINLIDNDLELMRYSNNDSFSFIKVVVSKIIYSDGDVWVFKDLDKWKELVAVETNPTEFKEAFNDKVNKNYLKATKDLPVSITYINQRTINMFAEDEGIVMVLKNNSSKTITNATLVVGMYDKNNLPISTYPYELVFKNFRGINAPFSLEAGFSSGEMSDSHFFTEGTKNYIYTIQSVEFADGSEWENEFIYFWMLKNYDGIK